MDQLTRLYAPAHFIKAIDVRYEGETILSAKTTFSMSENPSLRFYFVPENPGELEVDIIDTKEQQYARTFPVGVNAD